MIDIGANLGHESFSADLDRVMQDAREAGIEHIIVTGTSVEDSRQALALASGQPGFLSATAGIHPHEAGLCNKAALDSLRQLAKDPLVRALGETGLDFHRDYSPRDIQESSFLAQLELAADMCLPVFLHQRDAHERFMHILKPLLPDLPKVVVHCFTGSGDELREYIDHDLYVGITGWICDERRGHHLHPLMKLIPRERLLLETDSPYLLPRTIRPKPASRRNVPANLRWVLATVADCLDEDPALVAEQTSANAKRFFCLDFLP